MLPSSINEDDNIELLLIPRRNEIDVDIEGNTLESYENFIDSHIDNIRYENLKSRIYDDILHKVLESVRKECFTSSSVSDRKSEKLKKEDQNELVAHLKNEIDFLREEIRQKNIMIQTLSTKSMMHEGSKNHHKITNVNGENQINQNFNEISTVSPEGIANGILIKDRLDKQLKIVRQKYRDEFNEKKNKSINDKTLEGLPKDKTCTNNIKKRNIIVCGDSMTNGLDNNGLSSKHNKTTIRSFSGATSADMVDFVKPFVDKKPDMLIIHAGTNDLTKEITSTTENFEKIIHYINKNSPTTEVVISNICLREDKPNLMNKRNALNKEIEKIAHNHNKKIIDNSNIDTTCLSKKKLHLNRKGLAKLAKNMKSYIIQNDEKLD